MDEIVSKNGKTGSSLAADAAGILAALSFPVLVLDRGNRILFVNSATEQFFEHGASGLLGQSINKLIAEDSPVHSLVGLVREEEVSISEHGLDLELPRGGGRGLTVHASPFAERDGAVVLSIHAHGAARNMERQLIHRNAARSVTAMASMLAHEVKNPLAGIRGAAQLLERSITGQDQALARLIRDETDRINALVDRMGVFADEGPPDRQPVNIHEVLDRVQKSAAAGFAQEVRIVTLFDPSLPPVYGNRDQLIQVFLNLVKNAAEAVPRDGGEISINTGFRRGVRLAVPGGTGRVHLPLMVSIRDNGSGIPDDIAPHLFDPFVSTKTGGTGLGLALVAKVVNDHGGVIEFESGGEGTVFRVCLPVVDRSLEEGETNR